MIRTPLLVALVCASLGSGACGPRQQAEENPGISGMAQHGASSYLVVHDTKSDEEGARLGWVEVSEEGAVYSSVHARSWPDGEPSNDLESACALPGEEDEFLVAESGCWGGAQARLFHVCVMGKSATVLESYELPCPKPKSKGIDGDEYEGLACLGLDEDRVLVILGERGGSDAYETGVLRWGVLNVRERTLDWRDGEIEVEAPSMGAPENLEKKKRHISALHLDAQGTLWTAAALEHGDLGPFRSLVYELGKVDPDDLDQPVSLEESSSLRFLEGLKVEGIAGSAKGTGASDLSIGSEDEDLGGVWRPLASLTSGSDPQTEEDPATEPEGESGAGGETPEPPEEAAPAETS